MDKTYIIIEQWMIDLFRPDEAKKGAGVDYIKLLIFAYIYSFSRDGASKWYGKQQTLAEMVGCGENTCQVKLKQLVDDGFIEKEVVKNYGMFHHNNYNIAARYLQKEPYTLQKEPYTLQKEPYTLQKEPYTLQKEPQHSSEVTNNIYNNKYNNINNSAIEKQFNNIKDLLDSIKDLNIKKALEEYCNILEITDVNFINKRLQELYDLKASNKDVIEVIDIAIKLKYKSLAYIYNNIDDYRKKINNKPVNNFSKQVNNFSKKETIINYDDFEEI